MIHSILDNDLYKFTMQQAVYKLYPYANVTYKFYNRGGTIFPAFFGTNLKQIISKFKSLSLEQDEMQFLQDTCSFFQKDYLDYLSKYRYNSDNIIIKHSHNKKLSIVIKGMWLDTILWEVPLMATISELYYQMTGQKYISIDNQSKYEKLHNNNINFADFGTRRRYSFYVHEKVIQDCIYYAKDYFKGTSNLYFAKKYNLKPIGTVAHEWVMYHAAKSGYIDATVESLNNWIDVYGSNLSIVLPDTFTSDVFLKYFSKEYSIFFKGIRQDSGDPIIFSKKIINHYKKNKIDPKTKTIVFSDSLNSINMIKKIHIFCKNKIEDFYGIGTWLTNDVGVKPLNIVIKLNTAEKKPTIKLSDDSGKYTGDKSEIAKCKSELNLR